LEEVRGRVNEVRRKAEGKEQNTFVVTDRTETSAGHGHLRSVGKRSFYNPSSLQKKRGGGGRNLERKKGEMNS